MDIFKRIDWQYDAHRCAFCWMRHVWWRVKENIRTKWYCSIKPLLNWRWQLRVELPRRISKWVNARWPDARHVAYRCDLYIDERNRHGVVCLCCGLTQRGSNEAEFNSQVRLIKKDGQ